jgi:NitT/TauT family transport system substrate-binding protein
MLFSIPILCERDFLNPRFAAADYCNQLIVTTSGFIQGGGVGWKKIVAAVIVLAFIVCAGILLLAPEEKPTAGMVAAKSTVSAQAQKTKIKVGYGPFTYSLPWLVAKEKGFFQEQGLDAEMVKFETFNQLMEALVQDKIQFGGAGYSTLFAMESTAPGQLKTFGNAVETMQKYQSALLVPVNSSVQSIYELRGKKIGTYTGTTQRLWIQLIFKKFGWEKDKDYEIVQVAPTLQVQALAAGQFDALFTIEPHATVSQEKGVARVLVANPRGKYIMDPFPAGPLGVLSTKFLQENEETARRIRVAVEKAAEFISKNEVEARKTLPKYVPLDEETSLKMGIYAWKESVSEKERQDVQKLADLLHENGELKNKVDTRAMWLEG